MDIEVRIMGVPLRRQQYILPLLEKLHLPETVVTYDYEMAGNPLQVAKKAWLKPTNADFVCLLQDDIDISDNFYNILDLCASNFPTAVFSFYNPRLKPTDASRVTPYVKVSGCGVYGPAIMMPAPIINTVFWWGDEIYGTDFKHDDIVIGFFCAAHKLSVMTTIPGIVQHLGGKNSMMKHNNSSASKVFDPSPDVSFFTTNSYIKSRYIPNTAIVPVGGYKKGDKNTTVQELCCGRQINAK